VAALLVASGLHLLLKTSAIPDKSLPEKPGKTLGDSDPKAFPNSWVVYGKNMEKDGK
jgi:hypothetical protein